MFAKYIIFVAFFLPKQCKKQLYVKIPQTVELEFNQSYGYGAISKNAHALRIWPHFCQILCNRNSD